jgi:mono/diheme cytochrome c family protein
MTGRPAHFSLIVVFVVAPIIFAGDAQAQNPGGNPDARKMKNPVASTKASVTAGAAAFKKYCAFCHGTAAKGDGSLIPKGMTTPADLTDATWDRGSTDGEIFAVIMEGAGPKFEMKGLKGKIEEREAWQIVNFLRSLGPKTVTR